MDNKQLERSYRIVGGAHNFDDVQELFYWLAAKAADIRQSVGVKEDSLEIRKAIASYLGDAVDTMNRIRKNESSKAQDVSDDTY